MQSDSLQYELLIQPCFDTWSPAVSRIVTRMTWQRGPNGAYPGLVTQDVERRAVMPVGPQSSLEHSHEVIHGI
jgi:hypothetical protein